MDSSFDRGTLLSSLSLSLPALVFLILCCISRRRKESRPWPWPTENTKAAAVRKQHQHGAIPSGSKPTQWYRELFFKLQNLEDHQEVLGPARDELITLFSRAISLALKHSNDGTPSMEIGPGSYDPKLLREFFQEEHGRIMTQWKEYLRRREQGHPPELFATQDEAREWLVRQAPVKLIDGAWLGHINKISTPFALRSVTKNAFQILSEELGDGDLSKHHVHIYRRLLEEIGCPLPRAHSKDFIELELWDAIDNHKTWEAAVGQTLISLFPMEFLPEILGFNMHYELITMETLQAAHELKELAIDPYYFFLHISIDNADSGHAAVALHIVMEYLDTVRATEGPEAMEQAWKRVQVGYALSRYLGRLVSPQQDGQDVHEETHLYPLDERIAEIFRAKALVCHRLHSQSNVRIGDKRLSQWLSPDTWNNTNDHQTLLNELSQAKPWIHAGASSKSLLVRELSWKGRMFGAFTCDEVQTLKAWIDSLPVRNTQLYWIFTGQAPPSLAKGGTELPTPETRDELGPELEVDLELHMGQASLNVSPSTRPADLIPLWFAHIGLLENTIINPSRTDSPLYANIIRILRAQAGFETERSIVAGMDEIKRCTCTCTSLADMGLEMVARAGWALNGQPPACLEDVLNMAVLHGQDDRSAQLTRHLERWANRPVENLSLLLGLSTAFLELKDAVLRSPGLLGHETLAVLKAIVARERSGLLKCAEELRVRKKGQYEQMVQGYLLSRRALGWLLF